jgi:hypothetical protein
MENPMVELWKETVTTFQKHVQNVLDNENIQEEARNKIVKIPGVLDSFIVATARPNLLYTRDNLDSLVKCWVDFCALTHGVEYWRKEFPEWSSMISQFQIFLNEYQIKEIMHDNKITKVFLTVVQEGMKDIQEGKKNIQDIKEGMKNIQERMVFVDADIKNIKGEMTATTSSIKDLQGRVRELERPWYSRSGKKKAGSVSGERMVDLLEDLEKLSCSEKREED